MSDSFYIKVTTMSKPTKLTPEIQDKIVKSLRAGSFRWVAAGAAGIDTKTLGNWLKNPKEPFASFRKAILAAETEARQDAEARVYKIDPKFWLRCGPGRQRIEQGEMKEGWTETSGAIIEEKKPLASVDWQATQAAILKALEPFPDARAAVASALIAEKQKLLPS